jgi:uncharacterized damage-inducible protein DinB
VTASHLGAEGATLLATLQSQRAHVLGTLADLDDDTLRRPALPTGWTMLGMVNHLTYDIEQFWFRAVVAGEQPVIDHLPTGDEGWRVPDDRSTDEMLAAYRAETALADAIIGATPLDTPPAWWPEELFGTFRLDDLREVLLHVIVETACHAGHLDVARELIDGRTWLVLT